MVLFPCDELIQVEQDARGGDPSGGFVRGDAADRVRADELFRVVGVSAIPLARGREQFSQWAKFAVMRQSRK